MTSLIFLGAGASSPFNIPTMREMVDDYEKELKKTDSECFKFYSHIKNTLQEKYASRQIDIESIFSVLDGIVKGIKAKDLGYYAYYHIQEFCKSYNVKYPEGGPTQNYYDKAKKTRELLINFIKNSCKIETSELQAIYKKTYFVLFSNIPGTKVSPVTKGGVSDWKAYTTNYDIIFDDWVDAIDKPNTHFEKENNSKEENYFFKIKLLEKPSFCKLHGSINWTIETKTGRTMLRTGKFSPYDTQGDVMLFPIQQKDLYLDPWFTLFSDLRYGLLSQSFWYVIGYAFNDEFILNTFREILSSNENKILVIIDPNAREIVNKKFDDLRDRIKILDIEFGGDYFVHDMKDFANQIKTLNITLEVQTSYCNIIPSYEFEYEEIPGKSIKCKLVNPHVGIVFENQQIKTEFNIKVKLQNMNTDLMVTILTTVSNPVKISISSYGREIKTKIVDNAVEYQKTMFKTTYQIERKLLDFST